MAGSVALEPWGPGDRGLLDRLLGDPAMMTHLGGPESEEKLADRQARYEANPHALKVLVDGEPAGWVGWWPREEAGEGAFELGWSVVPEMQGQGVARAATAAMIEQIRAEHPDAPLHAYPSVDNAPSNALCRSLGFRLLGAGDFEYPPGHRLRCNDWILE